MKSTSVTLRKWLPRFVHVYGGGTVCSIGLALVHPGVGLAVGGAFLVYLGLTWVK